ncbi:hypothetical protein JCM14469_24730 [Desulfatiferula olefinivorans]
MKKSLGMILVILILIGGGFVVDAAEMTASSETCPGSPPPGAISGSPFDYESGNGYVDAYDHGNRMIVTLSDCTQGSFFSGDKVPARLTVLTPGVYWAWTNGLDADDVDNAGNYYSEANGSDAIQTELKDYVPGGEDCAASFPADGSGRVVNDVVYTYTLEDGTIIRTTVDASGMLAGMSDEISNDGTVIGNWCGEAQCPSYEFQTSSTGPTVLPMERIVRIQASNIRTITDSDINANRQKFYINLPSLVYDESVFVPGTEVTVLIEYGRVPACQTCFACESERTIVSQDTDNDGTADDNDGCPNDAGKTAPGVCGCGTPDTDSDGDGTPDCNEGGSSGGCFLEATGTREVMQKGTKEN